MGDGWSHGFGGLWMIFIWVLPLVLIIWAFGAFRGRQGGKPGAEPRDKTALDLLDEEYAGGRIDREEYLRRKEDLKR